MMELKALVCERCGGAIDRRTMRCPFCGTEYAIDTGVTQIRFVPERPNVRKIISQVRVDYDMMRHDPEQARAYVLDRMRQDVADGLLAFMKSSTATDFYPTMRCEVIRGEVRVIDPEFAGY